MSGDEEALKRRYREFMDLMPVTLSIAGLATAEGNRNFTTEQMTARSQLIATAFKLARQAVREAIKG
jgi:hypothetical protein